jgi:exodeoxyribonuclease-3
MKIATWNINSVRRRMPLVLDWLAANQPDVLCLQETKAPDSEFPAAAFRDAGYHVAFRGMKGYNGVATLTRREPESVFHGLCAGPDSEDVRILETVVDGIPIVNTYVPQGYKIGTDKYVFKLEWFHRVRRYFGERLDPLRPAIWLGDLNVAPEPIDVYHADHRVNDPDFHVDAREAYRFAAGWGTPSRITGDGASTTLWRPLRWPPFAGPAMWTWKHAALPEHRITPRFGRSSTRFEFTAQAEALYSRQRKASPRFCRSRPADDIQVRRRPSLKQCF